MRRSSDAFRFVDKRSSTMKALRELVYGYTLPTGWEVMFAESSVRFTSPDKSKTVKVQSDRHVVIDVVYLGKIRSNTFTCDSVDAAWKIVKTSLDAYAKTI